MKDLTGGKRRAVFVRVHIYMSSITTLASAIISTRTSRTQNFHSAKASVVGLCSISEKALLEPNRCLLCYVKEGW